jgi:hypothetical protein
MKQKLTNFWNKIKSNKGKLGAAALASVIGVNVFDVNPTIINGISEAREKIAEVTKQIMPTPKPKIKEKLPTKEDLTTSEYTGMSVYIDKIRYRVVISKEDLNRVLDIQEADEDNVIEFYDEESPIEVDNENLGEYWVRVHCSKLVNEIEKAQCIKKFRKI